MRDCEYNVSNRGNQGDYSLALWQMWIWYRRSLSITIKATVDGLIYALLSAATFAWLWPH